MILIGNDSTRAWLIEYESEPGRFETYREEALTAVVTDGGTLVFRDLHSDVIRVVSPSGWTQVTPL